MADRKQQPLSVEERLRCASQTLALVARYNYLLASGKAQQQDLNQGHVLEAAAAGALTHLCEEAVEHLAAVEEALGAENLNTDAPAPDVRGVA